MRGSSIRQGLLTACVRLAVMLIESIAILGRSNEPLFFRSLSSDQDEFEAQSLVFMSLDFLEEKLSVNKTADPFLGLYYFLDHVNFYAYCSASLVKVVAVLRWTDMPPKDTQVKTMLQRIHERYVGFANNPFHSVGINLNAREIEALNKDIALIRADK